MTIDKFYRMTAEEIISRLAEEFKDDEEALESIERTKANIAYIESKKDYKGQTPKQCALELAGNLYYWH